MSDRAMTDCAYGNMLRFLEEYVGGCGEMPVDELLGSLALSDDGISMDPAASAVWNRIWAMPESAPHP